MGPSAVPFWVPFVPFRVPFWQKKWDRVPFWGSRSHFTLFSMQAIVRAGLVA